MGARRLPCTINSLSSMRAAWLAALVDGEGTISIHLTPNGSKRAWIAVYNTNVEILERCLSVTGVGVVREKKIGKKKDDGFKRLPMWEWVVERARDAHNLLCQMYPYLIIKQYKAIDLIIHWSDPRVDILPDDPQFIKELKTIQGDRNASEFSTSLGFTRSYIGMVYKIRKPTARILEAIKRFNETSEYSEPSLRWR